MERLALSINTAPSLVRNFLAFAPAFQGSVKSSSMRRLTGLPFTPPAAFTLSI
jgi:hypothetical protein